jgi:hypothetical protein
MLSESDINTFFDKLNNELTCVNNSLKTEKDTKKMKLLLNQSELINSALNKLTQIKTNNLTLKTN